MANASLRISLSYNVVVPVMVVFVVDGPIVVNPIVVVAVVIPVINSSEKNLVLQWIGFEISYAVYS